MKKQKPLPNRINCVIFTNRLLPYKCIPDLPGRCRWKMQSTWMCCGTTFTSLNRETIYYIRCISIYIEGNNTIYFVKYKTAFQVAPFKYIHITHSARMLFLSRHYHYLHSQQNKSPLSASSMNISLLLLLL